MIRSKLITYKQIEEKTPGPGAYELRGVSIDSLEGKQTLSVFKSARVTKFPGAPRPFTACNTQRSYF